MPTLVALRQSLGSPSSLGIPEFTGIFAGTAVAIFHNITELKESDDEGKNQGQSKP
jgi:hypothetical protein